MTHDSGRRGDFNHTQARHVRRCLKEAKFVACVWIAALFYCTVAFWKWGYVPPEQRPETPEMIWGVPVWVAGGLFLPWVVLIAVTWLFAAFLLKDDEPFMEFPDKPG